MNEQLILERNFIFDANNEKGFKKLRDNQFPRIEQGIVYEPLANAMDQQQGSEPVEITLEKEGDNFRLSVIDNGIGLTRQNLEALYYIGKSTKKENREEFIGRFGMGLAAAFHTKLGVSGVQIETNVCGKPSRIIYDCSPDGIPFWRREDLKRKGKGFKITFTLPTKKALLVKEAIDTLLTRSIVPIKFNNKLYFSPPSALTRSPDDIVIAEKGDHEIFYTAHIREDPWTFGCVDDVSVFLRGMPVEEGTLYHVFQSSSGDKMPQNYHSAPYLKHETCIVSSRKAEPTVGRDKVVRNDAFEEIKLAVEKARVQALRELLQKGLDKESPETVRHYADEMAAANLYSLSTPLKEHLKGNKLSGERTHLLQLLEDLLNYPLFPDIHGRVKFSVRDIIRTKMPGGVYFFSEERSASDYFSTTIGPSLILLENAYSCSVLWGGYTKARISDVLKPLVEALEGREMIFLDDLRWNDKKVEELQSKGVIKVRFEKVRVIDKPDDRIGNVMTNLKNLLNRPWFRDAIARFNPPRRIHLKPIEPADSGKCHHRVAGILSEQGRNDELFIGVHVRSEIMKILSRHPSGHLAFLPILCHELANRRRILAVDGHAIPHHDTSGVDRIRLEDRVLSGCVKYLMGEETSQGGASDIGDNEVVVL